MSALTTTVTLLPAQDFDDGINTVLLATSVHSRERLTRNLSSIPDFSRL